MIRRATRSWFLPCLAGLWAACGEEPEQASPPPPEAVALPGHNDCLPDGEPLSLEVCLAVVEADGRLPTTSLLSSGGPLPDADDPRLTDPDYVWLTETARSCTCACCHSSVAGGPAAHRWDLDFEPVWIDSANDWVLSVFMGETGEYEQTLPTDDPERLRAVIEKEQARREAF